MRVSQLYKSVVLPTVLYGCEMQNNLKSLDLTKLNIFQHFIVRRIQSLRTCTRSDMWQSLLGIHPTRLTRRVPQEQQVLFTLPEHLRSSPVFSGVRVTRSLVLCVSVDRCLSFHTFLLTIVLSFLLRFKDSDYPFCIFKLFLSYTNTRKLLFLQKLCSLDDNFQTKIIFITRIFLHFALFQISLESYASMN